MWGVYFVIDFHHSGENGSRITKQVHCLQLHHLNQNRPENLSYDLRFCVDRDNDDKWTEDYVTVDFAATARLCKSLNNANKVINSEF